MRTAASQGVAEPPPSRLDPGLALLPPQQRSEQAEAQPTLPADVLDRYTGMYVIRRAQRETYLTITRLGRSLSLEISGRPGSLELSARGEHVFVAPLEIELTFVVSDACPATQLRYRQRGTERVAERADLGQPF
jgi:hypothetical protein